MLDTLPCITVIRGEIKALEVANDWLYADSSLVQNPIILYLTGLNQDKVALLLNPFNKEVSLFLPKYDEHSMFWEGHYIGAADTLNHQIKQSLGVDHIYEFKDLHKHLLKEIDQWKQSSCMTYWNEPQSHQKPVKNSYWVFKKTLEQYFKRKKRSICIKNSESFMDTRLCLDSHSVSHLETANQLSSNIFKKMCNTLSSLNTESEVAGIIKGGIYEASWLGQSFPAIVASGRNALILHYKKNNDPLDKDGLLLCDFGCRYHSMPADITRTVPVNGRFNPLQRCLYEIVLEAQKKTEAHVKEGVTIESLNTICWNSIEKQLSTYIFNKGGKIERSYIKRPHNVSHLIAQAVHDGDPYRNYRNEPLKAGMILSNEPGFYGRVSIVIDGKQYNESIGIRIEDNLLVTQSGCKNLSKSCPKEIQELEKLLNNLK